MSWLAEVSVDRESAARLRLFDTYSWHQAVWAAFPEKDGKDRDFLTRLDFRDGVFRLLLLSSGQPSRPPWCEECGWRLRSISAAFLNQPRYRFDLVANPTRKVVKLDRNGHPTKNGRREALLRADDQRAWLERKAGQAGFSLLDSPELDIDRAAANPFSIQGRQQHGLHFGVRYRGALRVENCGQFETAFHSGIGSAKAFGFGLLLLQPLVSN